MRLSEMNKEHFEKHIDSGDFSHQDVIDLYDDLQQARQTIDEYQSLIKILDRASRLAYSQEEDEDKPKFRMDANGNLTRI